MERLLKASTFGFVLIGAALGSEAVRAEATKEDQELVARVAGKFFELTPKSPNPDWAWPPLVGIGDSTEINAHATLTLLEPGKKPVRDFDITWIDVPFKQPAKKSAAESEDDKKDDEKVSILQPYIILYQGYLDAMVRGRDLYLAETFGHELSHITLGHIGKPDEGDTALLQFAFSRQQEMDADVQGVKYTLEAGYPYDELILAISVWREAGLKSGDNSLKHLKSTHPGWSDRVALVAEKEPQLWNSIAAFETGVQFLLFENYLLAERCFAQVTKEMPGCYEGWANLGYCRLMRYCDALEPDDLKEFDLDQLVVGGFYRRPLSIEPARGVDPELWFDAVGALREALRLKPELILAKANLAVAYLVHPNGKDVGKAAELFEQVVKDLQDGKLDQGIDPLDQVALLVNAGVAESATGNSQGGAQLFAQARQMLGATDVASLDRGPVKSAMLYSDARQMAASTDPAVRKNALALLEDYLASTSSLVGWWTLAYERYTELCKAESVEAKSADSLKKAWAIHFRPVLSLPLADGKVISINEPVAEVAKVLPDGKKSTIIRRTNIHSLKFDDLNLELVCSDRVLAIRVLGDAAPPLKLQASGTGGAVHDVRVGMVFKDLEKLLAGDVRGWQKYYAVEDGVVFRYFHQLGFGVRLDKDSRDGKVVEIIVAQLPREAAVTAGS